MGNSIAQVEELTSKERRLLERLNTPFKIQRFLDDLGYDLEPEGPRCRSPRLVMRDAVAHCMSGALMAAAALSYHGDPPLLVDLAAVRDDDHVLAVFRRKGLWGALAKSNYSGLRSREPVYRTLRELVMSYFEHYYNPRGEKTLRGYSRTVNLDRFRRKRWISAPEDVWFIPEYLCEIGHFAIAPDTSIRMLNRMDKRLFAAGRLGAAH
jgi:hypothetical protein